MAAANRSLDSAFEKTSKDWFPANPKVMARVLSRVESGYYDARREALVDDLKADFSLYLSCLKELRSVLAQGKTRRPVRDDGDAEKAKPERDSAVTDQLLLSIKNVLKESAGRISKFSLEKMTEAQAFRLRDSLLSASTAEVLSEKFQIDGRLAFTCALLRQLGLTLIAWNYPDVYQQALNSLAELKDPTEADFDAYMQNTLGFTPAMLGVRFAETWDLPPEIVTIMGASGGAKSEAGALNMRQGGSAGAVGVITQLCVVGEAFARANDPARYPHARDDWETVEKVIIQCLGPQGVQAVYQHAKDLSTHYAAYSPRVLSIAGASDGHVALNRSEYGRSLFEKNVYIRACPERVRSKLADVYAELHAGGISQALLRKFVHEIMPALGFDTVVGFTLDPTTASLVPMLKVGRPSFIRLKPAALIEQQTQANPITTAYSRHKPLCEVGITRLGERKTLLVGAMGKKRRIGVLYVEVSSHAPIEIAADPMIVFQALLSSLSDLLLLQ